MNKASFLIFGGSGFIGTHLTKFLSGQGIADSQIYNLDIANKSNCNNVMLHTDVRLPIDLNIDVDSKSIIFNLAAVHTTPGHPDHEYFETNVWGAENVCDFARKKNINTIIFTSSIAPYGVSEDVKTEDTLPMPNTPYGISKLSAEYIHKLWQAEEPLVRKLVIIRPGVVFGKNEGQNFTRLYKAINKKFFFYPGRKDTIKAAVYVKDVARLLYDTAIEEPVGVNTFNLSYYPAPTIQQICHTIAEVTNSREPHIVVSKKTLQLVAAILYWASRLVGKKINGIHPDRVKKLMISTNVSGEKLSKSNYKLRYTLRQAIEDWYADCEKKGLS